MKHLLLAALLVALPQLAHAQSKQQALVDRSTIALQEMLSNSNDANRQEAMREARAVMICPQVFRAGFVLGGSGGDCVLLARDGGGSWSAPAFYAIGSGSVGLQIGVQDAEFIMMILTNKGLAAIMDNQFKFGGDASIAVATIGSGVEGSTTAALHADIVAYSKTRGLFAGAVLQGSILSSDTAWNHAYYGADLAARQIVMQMQANNAGANPLRGLLTQYGGRPAQRSYGADYNAPRYSPGYAPPHQPYRDPNDSTPYSPEARSSVSQQSLPPVGH
jgi:lipid-binding SYLF domain-containing protein